ncbi:hypothetical protein [Actinacidiphila glaucinigra]|uniref:hypothetical protein n=1 Tax=Actinacidiphila glaucinigra TaxID=235986 RepID=UPI0035D602FB
MVVSLSVVVLVGIVVVVLVKLGHVRTWPAAVCALFGFLLASTGLAPVITSALGSLTGWISTL